VGFSHQQAEIKAIFVGLASDLDLLAFYTHVAFHYGLRPGLRPSVSFIMVSY